MTVAQRDMTLEQFRSTCAQPAAPEALSPALRAMWHDARGDWNEAHSIVQGIDDQTGSWIHAYLHRKEGDFKNAGYWYRRAGQTPARDALDEEWTRIVTALLQDTGVN